MTVIHKNERNKVLIEDSSVYKYFSNPEEFKRERNALVYLQKNKPSFAFQKLETISTKDLCIKTSFVFQEQYSKLEKIKLMELKENQKLLANFLIEIHSFNIKNISLLGISGFVKKALMEGILLKSSLEKKVYQKVLMNRDDLINKYNSLPKKHFVHGDIQPDNMFFSESGVFLGFFDWGSSGRGSCEIDLRQLPCYFGEAGLEVIRLYNQKRKVNINILNFLTTARFLELFYNNRLKDKKDIYKMLTDNVKYLLD